MESETSVWGKLSRLEKHPLTWILIVVIPVVFVYRNNLFGVKTETSEKVGAIQGSTMFATPVAFRVYKPSSPQVPGQEKAEIKVKVTNQGGFGYLYNVHVTFLTDDGARHKTNSDTWNTQEGTKSLYTFDSIGPLKEEEVIWRPDLPSNAEQLYKTRKATFKVGCLRFLAG